MVLFPATAPSEKEQLTRLTHLFPGFKLNPQKEDSADEQRSSEEESHAGGLKRNIMPMITANKYGSRSERQWANNLERERGAKASLQDTGSRKGAEPASARPAPGEKRYICAECGKR